MTVQTRHERMLANFAKRDMQEWMAINGYDPNTGVQKEKPYDPFTPFAVTPDYYAGDERGGPGAIWDTLWSLTVDDYVECARSSEDACQSVAENAVLNAIFGGAGKHLRKIGEHLAGVPAALIEKAGAAVSDLRSTGSVARKRNIAAAVLSIKGNRQYTLLSASGEAIRPGTVPEVGSPGNPQRFIPFNTGNNTRFHETEFKLLNYIANQLGAPPKRIRGTIAIHSELKVCPSCNFVIKQFKEAFPNVRIHVTTG